MKNVFKLIIILMFIGCEKSADTEKDISYDDIIYIIEEYKNIEIKNNRLFEKKLILDSDVYFKRVTNNFLENEFNMSSSISDLKIRFKNTAKERRRMWKYRIGNYFSSVAYTRFIRDSTDNYANKVNSKRRENLKKFLNFKSKDSLVIEKLKLKSFKVADEIVTQSIDRANEGVFRNFEEAIVNATGIATLTTNTPILIVIEFAGSAHLISNTYFSDKDELKEVLGLRYNNSILNCDLEFSQELNRNTLQYYDNLKSLIQNRYYEKIKL